MAFSLSGGRCKVFCVARLLCDVNDLITVRSDAQMDSNFLLAAKMVGCTEYESVLSDIWHEYGPTAEDDWLGRFERGFEWCYGALLERGNDNSVVK